jgi:hypothetical protein
MNGYRDIGRKLLTQSEASIEWWTCWSMTMCKLDPRNLLEKVHVEYETNPTNG